VRQFAIPPEWTPGRACIVEGGRAHYLARVLRLATGDSFPGIDAQGGRWRCELREAAPGRLVIEIGPLPPDWDESAHLDDLRTGARVRLGSAAPEAQGESDEAARIKRPRIVLAQGLPKGAKMDLIVRQAAEAGVVRVIPLLCRRSASRTEEGSAARLERWRRIIREALQQSGSVIPTAVDEPVELAAYIESLRTTAGDRARPRWLGLLLDAEAPQIAASPVGTQNAKGVLGAQSAIGTLSAPLAQTSLHEYLTEAPDEIVLCIGPEGGFIAEESRILRSGGFAPLRLPCAVLRTETAALYAVAAVETVLSERSSWIPRPL
jgi:16S rRNA (uracil1498-N3)-methyltransferase